MIHSPKISVSSLITFLHVTMSATEQSVWGKLPMLVRANSKESVEYILKALWRTRKVGIDATDRRLIADILQLDNDADIDPLLVCLRMLIRRCVYENTSKDNIQKLFPDEVLPELQKLLTLLLQKFHSEWREDILKDQLQGASRCDLGEMDVTFQMPTETLETMLKSMYCIRDQLFDSGEASGRNLLLETNIL